MRGQTGLIPKSGVGQLIVQRLDITTFRSSLGAQRSAGMRHFADLGLRPTKVTDQIVEFDATDWFFGITVITRADRNGDGLEDLVVQVTDHAKNGTYRTVTSLLLTRFTESGELIALGFEP